LERRKFIMLVGSAAAVWPHAIGAQQPAVPVVGFLRASSPDARLTAVFQDGLKQSGYVEGQNVTIEYRWADSQDRLTAFAGELVRRRVAMIFAAGNSAAAAVPRVTTTIPVIAVIGDDPVNRGLVKSLNRPDANVTGVSFYSGAPLYSKRVELLHMLAPQAKVIALLSNPNASNAAEQASEALKAARTRGMELRVLRVVSDGDIDAAFTTIAQEQIGALMISGDAFFTSRIGRIVAFSVRHGLPALFNIREYAAAGGLMSYGASQTEAYRRAAVYVGKVLQGAKIADLPFMLPAKYELVINLNTAKAMGLTIPTPLLALADEVIE
jgi:putative tryptophan/tyrosine transport system substrate-binding protein